MSNKRYILLITVSSLLTLAIMSVMNFILIPSIESGTEGMRFFDLNFYGYSYESAKLFLSGITDKGRELALHIQMPLDFINPVSYTVFLISCFRLLCGKRSALELLPLMLLIMDYTENVFTLVLLKSDEPTFIIATAASSVTVIKSVLMCVSFLTAFILLLRKLLFKKRTDTELQSQN